MPGCVVSWKWQPWSFLPRAEDRRADADAGGAEGDGGLEVVAHAHGELRQAVSRGDLGQEREVRARGLTDRRDAHQPLGLKTVGLAAGGDEGVGLGGGDAGLLRLLAGVDLDVGAQAKALFLHLVGQHAGELVAIQRLDDVEEGHRVGGLVGLQRADQAQLDLAAARGPAFLGLLHAVLAEHPLAGGEHRRDRFPGLGLGDRHERDVAGRPAGGLHSLGDPGHDHPCRHRGQRREARRSFREASGPWRGLRRS